MAVKRKDVDALSPSPSPPPATTTTATTTTITRPTTPSSPVLIPVKHRFRDAAHPPKHRHNPDRKHRAKEAHSPDAIPPSVAALLAITSIPPPRSTRHARQTRSTREKRMTVEDIIERSQVTEKEFSLSLAKGPLGPLDLLLTAPEDLEDDDMSLCESTLGSALSTRTDSVESMPSLGSSFATEGFSSVESPRTPRRKRNIQPTRRSLEPVSSPCGEQDDHPLSSPDEVVLDDLDLSFPVLFDQDAELEGKKTSRLPFTPFKSAFKSNLTASLRALRQAARSISSLNLTSIPPDDFLTRSILTLDPKVPYTDERRPPPLEEEPTAELRRYLNPTTAVRLEQPSPSGPGPVTKAFTASIQMQTYKVHRARSSSSSSSRAPYPSAGPSAKQPASQSPQQQRAAVVEYPVPGPRQREMRENSDFIRVAVMEMAMRKRGKLDDQKPGRARWALPPRKTSDRPYAIGPDGVPARWVAISV